MPVGLLGSLKNLDVSSVLKNITGQGAGAQNSKLFGGTGLAPEAMQGRGALDKIADMVLAKTCHALGVAPNHFIRAVHLMVARVAQLDGYQPQAAMWTYTSDTGTEIPYVSLTGTGEFSITIHDDQNGVGFKDGVIRIEAYKTGNSETGEPVTMTVYGRRAQPEKYQLVAGQTKILPWVGVFDQAIHSITFRSGLGAAAPNDIQIYLEADTRALDLDNLRVARATLPDLEKAIISLDEAEFQQVAGVTATAIKTHPAMQAIVDAGQAFKLAGNKAKSQAGKLIK